ncbi:IclR family transcriptional regulator domain-containing protein [Propionibacteriaceae bacterium Y2011]
MQNEPDYLELLVTAAAEPLAALRDTTGETALLTVLGGEDAVALTQAESRHSLVARVPLGDRLPAHSSAQGLACLALLTPADGERFLPRRGVDLDRFRDDIANTRRRGYAVQHSDVIPGVTGLAVAVPNVIRLCAIGILAPDARIARGDHPGLAAALGHAASVIATGLAEGRAARLRAFNRNATHR